LSLGLNARLFDDRPPFLDLGLLIEERLRSLRILRGDFLA
jgi:hypothetical protein